MLGYCAVSYTASGGEVPSQAFLSGQKGRGWPSTKAAISCAGGYNLPEEVQALARAAGGIDALDRALQLRFEARLPADQVAEQLPEPARGPFLEAVQAGRFWRERAGLIPKLGARTIGIDLLG